MILFIGSRETDYLQDLTYSGLVDLLGPDSVLDYPYHWQYHREKRFFWSNGTEYPHNLGFVSSNGNPSRVSFREVRQALMDRSVDLVILGSAKPDALLNLIRLSEWILVPWVLIDGGDWSEVGGDFKRLAGQDGLDQFQNFCRKKSPAAIFKREMSDSGQPNVFPLQFSINLNTIPGFLTENKVNQVLFWAVESSHTRREVFRLLKGRYDCDRNGSVSGQVARRYRSRGLDYFRAVNQSQIALSFCGEGFDTLRYWEIPASSTLLISEKPTIQIPNNFMDRSHAVFCKNDLSDLLPLIDYYLEHEQEAREIAENGRKHFLKHHTHIQRAKYLLYILREHVGIKID